MRNRWWLAAGASPLAIALAALVVALVTGEGRALRMVPVTFVLAFALVARAWTRNRSPRFVPGDVEVDDHAVRFSGEVIARRAHVERAVWRTDTEAGPVVHLSRRWRPAVTLLLPTAAAARDLVRQLGFDPADRSVTFTCMSRAHDLSVGWRTATVFLAAIVPIVLAVAARLALGPASGEAVGVVMMIAIAIAVAVVVAWQLAPSRVDVGADGLLVRWLRRSTFIPFHDVLAVRSVQVEEAGKTFLGVELGLAGGARQRLLVTQDVLDDGARELLRARIAEALAHHQRSAPASEVASLARRGRDDGSWIAALRGLGAGAGADGTHRQPPASVERLWRVVEDAGRDAVSRAAAAVALGAGASSEDRARIRALARSSAEPRLRVALERGVDPAASDEAVAEALASVEAASSAPPARSATARS